MPQFDPHFFASQLFWLYACFIVLYVVLSTRAMPKIGEVLEERQRKIDDNLDKAGQLKAEAEAAVAVYEKALAESRAEAQRVLRAGADALSAKAEARQKEVGERLAAEVRSGEARITAAKQEALGNLRDMAADVAKTAMAKLTGVTIDDRSAQAAVTAALEESR